MTTRSAQGVAPSQLKRRGIKGGELAAQFILAARQNFAAYMALVHETDQSETAEPAKHHKVMIQALMEEGHTLIECPRGAAKTTIVQYWLEWILGKASESGDKDWANKIRIGYVTAAEKNAAKVSNAIRETIEANAAFQAVFPKVKPHKTKWSENEWKVSGSTAKDATFTASGINGKILGSRWDVGVLDDLVDDDIAKSPAEQEKVEFRFQNNLKKILVPWGRWVMLATRWYENDPPEWARSEGWRVVSMKSLYSCETLPPFLGQCSECDEGEHSFWPERFSLEFLRRERQKHGRSFALQMQNELVPYEGEVFKRAWFQKRFDYVPAPEDVRWAFATWDTASTLTGRSFSVGIVFLVDKDWRYYLLDMYRDQVEFHELCEAVVGVARFWNFHRGKRTAIIIENKSSGIQVVQEFVRRREKGELPIAVIPLQPPGERGRPARHEWNDMASIPASEGRVLLPTGRFLKDRNRDQWTDVFVDWITRYTVDGDGKPIGNNDVASAFCNGIAFCEYELRPAVEIEEQSEMPALEWKRSTERRIAV